VTPLLNKAEMPFRLKVLNDPSRFDRCDAGVLYLRRPDIATAAPLVEQIYRDVYDQLKPLTPAFTRPLAAGLGYADDPGGGRSFGAHRCHLLADAMIQAHETGARTITDRLDSVRRRFDQESVDLDAPFRAGSTAEPIDINIRQLGPPRRRTARGERACGAFLNASHEIGRQLARQASWHRGRCTWLGAASVAGSAERSSASLGPGLYSGCSGIALFLAELARTIGDDQIRATAVGAMEQALATSNSIPEDSRTGLFTGWIGIAFAGVRVGHLVADSRLVERATRLALQAARPDRTEPGFDLISGRSGAIVGLLTLRAMLDDESLLEPAARLGDAVIRSADVTPLGLSWNAAPGVAMKNLTGLSHGAAGAGHALLELAAATGDDGYRAAAMSAFDYERSYFDDRARNWPDFRIDTSVRGRRRLRDFSCTWCHGAPGIGLSRLRGYELFGDESMASDALIALATTREVVIEELHSGAANYSLCHGLAGNAEVLSYGHHVLPSPTAAEAGLVEQVADAGIEAYGGNEQPWPCGAHGGQTPDLMLGLAGIGYFYLRLHDKRVPSPLLLRPEVFREATKGSTLRAGIPQITREESVAPNSSVALGSTRTGRP
jgi:lantibiotic modifying enzyme